MLRELDPTVPVYQRRDAVRRSSTGRRPQQLFVTRLLAAFAAIAVMLAAIGLYGVVSYGVAQRTREVGVRVALGAQRRDVLRLVLSSGLSLVGVGVAVGLVAAVAATRFLGALIFGVSPVDPATFACAALLTIVALAPTCAHPPRAADRSGAARCERSSAACRIGESLETRFHRTLQDPSDYGSASLIACQR